MANRHSLHNVDHLPLPVTLKLSAKHATLTAVMLLVSAGTRKLNLSLGDLRFHCMLRKLCIRQLGNTLAPAVNKFHATSLADGLDGLVPLLDCKAAPWPP